MKPLNALHKNNSQIEFKSLPVAGTYRDLSSIYLKLRVRLMKDAQAGTKHTAPTGTDEAKVAPVNNILHSLFRGIQLSLNNTVICNCDNYHYIAYLENLFNYSPETASIHLESSSWSIDSGDFDGLTSAANPGFGARAKQFAGSVEVELGGKIHLGFFNQTKYLIDSIDMRVIFMLEKPSFYLMAAAGDTSSLEILDATLYMNYMTISPSILLAHHQVLQRKNVIYQYNHVELKSFTIAPGSQSLSITNVILGRLPNLCIVTFCENQAFTGATNKNPFLFNHQSISQFQLLVNGVPVPQQGLLFDYTNAATPISARPYDKLFMETLLDRSHQITKAAYDKNMWMVAFDLTQDKSYGDGGYTNIVRQGSIGIEARFSKDLDKTISVLVFAEFDAIVEIDKSKNVFTTKL